MAKLPKLPTPRPDIEARIHSVLNEERDLQPAREGLRLSAIGRCPRQLWATMHGVPDERPPTDRTLLIFEMGNYVELMVTSLLERAGYELEGTDPDAPQIYVEMLDGTRRVATGSADGIIYLGPPEAPRPHVLEIKSAKASKFEEVIAVGYEAWNADYKAQVHAYMGASHIHDALVIVLNKDTQEIHSERIKFDSDFYASLVAKARSVLDAKTLPDKPKEARGYSGKFCKWCPVNAWCYSPLREADFDE